MRFSIIIILVLIALHVQSQTEWEIIELENGNTKGAEIINAIRAEQIYILNDLQKDLLHDEEWRLPGRLYPLVLEGPERLIDLHPNDGIIQQPCQNEDCGTRSWCPYTSTWYACFLRNNDEGKMRWQLASWKESEELKWIDTGLEKCNLIHPAISENGEKLVFASDYKSNGTGFNLFICYRDGDKWTAALPLENVNSEWDDVFPSFWEEKLCFSSNRNGEKTGMDLYHCLPYEQGSVQSFPAPVNSDEDDLNIIFGGKDWAFISSRRKGGLGAEDLYIIRKKPQVFSSQKARIVLGSEPIRKSEIKVFDELGVYIGSFISDDEGYFVMPELAMGRRYRMDADIGNQKLKESANIELLNDNNEVVKVISANSRASFWFEMLPYEDMAPLKRLDNPDETVLLSIRIDGQIYMESPGDIGSGEAIILLDDKGNADELAYTDNQGKFSFNEVLPKANYAFSFDDSTAAQKIQLEGLEPSGIRNSYAMVERLKREDIQTLILSDGQKIEFKNGESLLVSKIGYGFNKIEPDSSGIVQLNKLSQLLKNNPEIKVEIRSHTDSRGSDEYNLQLSQDRAKKVCDLLTKLNVNNNSVEWKGMGESQLLNHCSDLENCNEIEHSVNRRTEIIIRNK